MSEKIDKTRHEFGTFGGVFTPAVLTIFGVIMFMRAGFVVGQAGILHALLILIIAKSITLLTGLSISAISTNTRGRGGGAHFLISRSLGPEFGGSIGLALFTAQTLSVPFYILGFAESLVITFPSLQTYFLFITLTVAGVLLSILTWAPTGRESIPFLVEICGSGLVLNLYVARKPQFLLQGLSQCR